MSRRRINSTLEDYFFKVRKLVVIFCDSCAGQNKKYTAIKFFHHTVCEINVFTAQKRCSRFVVISVWNADRDIWEKLVINLIPNYLTTGRMSFNKAAKKPTPFNVIDCAVEVEFKTWTDHVSDSYPTKCLISKRPIRMLLVEKKKTLDLRTASPCTMGRTYQRLSLALLIRGIEEMRIPRKREEYYVFYAIGHPPSNKKKQNLATYYI